MKVEYLPETAMLHAEASGLPSSLYVEGSGEIRRKPDNEPRIKFSLSDLGGNARLWPSLIVPQNGGEIRIAKDDKVRYKIDESNPKMKEIIGFMQEHRAEFMQFWEGKIDFIKFIESQKKGKQRYYSKNEVKTLDVKIRVENDSSFINIEEKIIAKTNEEVKKNVLEMTRKLNLRAIEKKKRLANVYVYRDDKLVFKLSPAWNNGIPNWENPAFDVSPFSLNESDRSQALSEAVASFLKGEIA